MKNLTIILLILTLLSCNKNQEGKQPIFNGYVVFKEYTPEHNGTKNEIVLFEARIIPCLSPAISGAIAASNVNNAKQQRERREYEENEQFFESKFEIWVANKHEVISVEVDSLYYVGVKCGDKVEIKYN